MLENYRIVYEGGEGEITEKKSKFIATVQPVHSEEEALAFIEAVKKKYWDARHNCFAYLIGDRNQLQRFSDDGEPGGTAGKPMLDVLLGESLHDAAVVVTRYFGGVLLGTGGLVRAYSCAVKAGLASAKIITRISGFKLKILTNYTDLGKIQYLLGQRNISVLGSVYTEEVALEVLTPGVELEKVRMELAESTGGRVRIREEEPCFFAEVDGRAVIL